MRLSQCAATRSARKATRRFPLSSFFSYIVAILLLWSCARVDMACGQIIMDGGAIILVGADSGPTTATFGNIIVNSGTSQISVSNGLGSGTTLDMSLITRNRGATLDFSVPAAPGFITTPTTAIDGLLGGYATVDGTDWAALVGSSPFTIHPVSTYAADVWAPGNHTTVTTSSLPPTDSTTASLRFNAAAPATLTLASGAGQANTISTGGILITPNVGANDVAIAAQPGGANLTSGNGQDLIVIQNNPLGSLILGATVADNGATPIGLTHSGPGTLVVSPATPNSYSGPTTINDGVLRTSDIGNAGATGGTPSGLGQSSNAAGNLVLHGGTLQYTGGATTTDRLFSIAGAGTIESSGGGPITFSNTDAIGFLNTNGPLLTLGGGNTGDNTFAPLIEDHSFTIFSFEIDVPVSLVKSGGGTWSLTNANSYTGATTIDDGILLVENVAGSATGTGPVMVHSGATLGGSGAIAGPVTFEGGTLTPGQSVDTLTLGSTLFDAASMLDFELDTPGVVGSQVNDLVAIIGDLTLDGTLNVTALDDFGAGEYRLFDYTGSLANNGLVVGSLPAGLSATVDTSTANQVNLLVFVPEPSTAMLAALGLALLLLGTRAGASSTAKRRLHDRTRSHWEHGS